MKRSPIRRTTWLNRRTPLKRTRPKRQSFSQRYDGTGPRYGTLFVRVRDMPCWLAEVGYTGPGHERCGLGSQGGHTAHHMGREDSEGLLPGCGCAHDLYAGYGGKETVRAFREWLMGKGFRLEDVAMEYVERAITHTSQRRT